MDRVSVKDHYIDAATGQLVVHGEPYLIRGVELHNSTASSASYLEPLWRRLKDASVNTVLAPVSWELVEPAEGTFDFSLVDAMLAGAREHGLRLVLLWFGSWKNASSSYTPAWVKLDPDRFPLQSDAAGRPLDNLSPFSETNRRADAAAFAAFMDHLATADDRERTVIMVQVENEVGLLGAARSYGPDAEAAWAAPVPSPLVRALRKVATAHVSAPAGQEEPTWEELLGDPDRKAELFMAWHYAEYVQHVAEAGAARHDVPLFVNAWLDSIVPQDSHPATMAVGGGSAPGVFPSGGPLPHVSAAWKLAAPAISFLAPDVYFGDFEIPFDGYARTNTTLFVPEMRADSHGISHAFLPIGKYRGIGVALFGFDSVPVSETKDALRTFTQLAVLEKEILRAQVQDRIRAFRIVGADEQRISLGRYEFVVRGHSRREGAAGYGLLIQRDEDTFVTAGHGFTLEFSPVDGNATAILEADELVGHEGELIAQRRLNGDETYAGSQIRIADDPDRMHGFMLTSGTLSGVVRFSLYTRG